jgi:hypothetical protein
VQKAEGAHAAAAALEAFRFLGTKERLSGVGAERGDFGRYGSCAVQKQGKDDRIALRAEKPAAIAAGFLRFFVRS